VGCRLALALKDAGLSGTNHHCWFMLMEASHPFVAVFQEHLIMNIIRALFAALAGLFANHTHISAHQRNQAYGPRWSQRRRRHIDSYRRRQSRRR
jgi:hypothetical protein